MRGDVGGKRMDALGDIAVAVPALESREPRNQVLSKILLKIISKFSF